ncbi:MAG: M23 family metallopeptidase [Bacteroidales bacterium]|nr:M23 family metallopeptidase [Candidatus Cryptobacteroides aphodequi]
MPSKQREYKFNDGDFNFEQPDSPLAKIFGTILKLMGAALAVAIVAYLIFSAVVTTDTEARMREENRMYGKLYHELVKQEKLLSESLELLESKDNAIYNDVFHTSAPSVDPIATLGFMPGADSIPWGQIFSYTKAKATRLCDESRGIEDNFRAVFDALSEPDFDLPPMSLPLSGLSYAQVGASMGMKHNPILKTEVQHQGIDFIVPTGEPVFATAPGVVKVVEKASKGLGNMVAIEHAGGYVSRYAHLSTVKVSVGQKVLNGSFLGTAGMSGSAYAPHLHYEVLRYGEPLDPVGYIFASVLPEDYTNMLYMAINTEQSMD